ncbi:MAG: hypothetical protein ABW039_08815 [Sphingobium sp.]
MALSRENVIWVYRTLLRRDPENEQVVDENIALHPDRIAFILAVAGSEEYRTMYRHEML